MNRAIYPILSGAVAHEKQLQVFAHNLANVNTAGFKQDQQGFRGLLARASSTGMSSTFGGGVTSTIAMRPAEQRDKEEGFRNEGAMRKTLPKRGKVLPITD